MLKNTDHKVSCTNSNGDCHEHAYYQNDAICKRCGFNPEEAEHRKHILDEYGLTKNNKGLLYLHLW